MANMVAGTTTLTSTGPSTSTAIQLDPTARTTSLHLSLNNYITNSSAGATADITIQATYDFWSATNLSSQFSWGNLSTTHYSSASGVGSGSGFLITVTGPISGVRLNSTTWNSTIAAGANAVTLKALQALTAGP